LKHKKGYILRDEAKSCQVENYVGLRVENMLEWAKDYSSIQYVFPDVDEQLVMPRQWIIDVCNTEEPEAFQKWRLEQVAARDQKRVQEHIGQI
jgi:hypothetical protein